MLEDETAHSEPAIRHHAISPIAKPTRSVVSQAGLFIRNLEIGFGLGLGLSLGLNYTLRQHWAEMKMTEMAMAELEEIICSPLTW